MLPDVAASFAKADVEAELHEPALVQKKNKKILQQDLDPSGAGPSGAAGLWKESREGNQTVLRSE